jgi:hypothetical protein
MCATRWVAACRYGIEGAPAAPSRLCRQGAFREGILRFAAIAPFCARSRRRRHQRSGSKRSISPVSAGASRTSRAPS